jgi:hypothetical protein
VRVLERRQRRQRERACRLPRQRAFPQAVLKGPAAQAFEHQRVDATVDVVIDTDDVEMTERRQDTDLGGKASAGIVVVHQVGPKLLDRDGTPSAM